MPPQSDPLAAALMGLMPPAVSVIVRRELSEDHEGLEGLSDPSPTMAPRRRAEFRTGRACAAHALAAIGRDPVAVGVGDMREPLWPEGVVGSITHTDGIVAAAVADATVVPALGIDAEPAVALTGRVAGVVTGPGERERAAELGVVDTVLFAAREAVFKAWFPSTGMWLDFADVELDLAPGSFTVRPARRLLADPERAGHAPWLTTLDGRWAVTQGLVLCAATAPGVSTTLAP